MGEEKHNDIYEKIGHMAGLIESSHQIHEVNRKNIEKTLDQTTKTNGRVTLLEKTVEMLAKLQEQNAVLISDLKEKHTALDSWKRAVMAIVAFVTLFSGAVGLFVKLYIQDVTAQTVDKTR